MGILRTDRVSGLGGANAIKGSAFFAGDGSYIQVDPSSDLSLSNSDFTVETFINFIGFDSSGFDTILMRTNLADGNTSTFQFDYKNSTSNLRFVFYVSNSSVVYESSWSPDKDRWYHIAACRSGSNLKLFVDGTQIGSTHDVGSSTMDSDLVPLHIGRRAGNNQDRELHGYLSNLRIINGSALYTSNFTAPNRELTKTSDTVLLCFQSSSNILKEETDKILDAFKDRLNDAPVSSSRFTPNSPVGFSTTTDVGTQFGTTFDGVTTFDSQAYMVVPGGNTRERNRGRGLFAGGDAPIGSNISSIEIQSQGNAADFGDLTQGRLGTGSVGSSTRGVISSGYKQPSPDNVNIIDFVTIANISNATDFGDSTQARHELGASSSETRGVFGGGTYPSLTNIIDFVTIATLGAASDFGDLTQGSRNVTGVSSPTRSVFMGGRISGDTASDVLDFVTIASTGDATDFGNLSAARGRGASVCSSTRGIMCGGETPTAVNTIDFITIASAGNATDFGDCISIVSNLAGGASNKTRGAFCVGYIAPAYTNAIQFVTIATTGNSDDFGDNTAAGGRSYGFSDSHGGIE